MPKALPPPQKQSFEAQGRQLARPWLTIALNRADLSVGILSVNTRIVGYLLEQV
jgi:hypothetical protein